MVETENPPLLNESLRAAVLVNPFVGKRVRNFSGENPRKIPKILPSVASPRTVPQSMLSEQAVSWCKGITMLSEQAVSWCQGILSKNSKKFLQVEVSRYSMLLFLNQYCSHIKWSCCEFWIFFKSNHDYKIPRGAYFTE